MALPIDLADLLRSTRRLGAEREAPLLLMVVIDPEAGDDLIDAITGALVPKTARAVVMTEVASGPGVLFPDATDAVIAISGPEGGLPSILRDARLRALPALVLSTGEDAHGLARSTGHPVTDCRVVPDAQRAPGAVAAWLVDRIAGKRLALAHNFDFARRAVAEEAVRATAVQNGLIGAAVIIPGADMPLITLNQGKMLLQIAAAYGQPLGVERVKELSVVVGGGFALRAVARQAAGAVPGLGWAVKGAVAYGGTAAMGRAAIAHFERGGDLSQIAAEFAAMRETAARTVRERKRLRVAPLEEIADPSADPGTDGHSAH